MARSEALGKEEARDLIQRFGWNTTCFQILNTGIDLWFSARRDAVVGFVRANGVRVVAGAPVCSEQRFDEVVREWEECAASRVCYFGAEGRMRSISERKPGYASVVLGSQPLWNPASLVSKFQQDATLRAQKARAANKGIEVREWPAAVATNHPDLHRVLSEWLQTRGLPPMHFLVESETLGDLAGRRIFVAEKAGAVVGFLVLSPFPARKGWLTEQFVRGHQAPNGTVELMMIRAAQAVAMDGDELITMGIVPLSLRGESTDIANPLWLDTLARWARAHGRRFYNFGGLEWFKHKFHPDYWEPIYVISNERTFSFRSFYAAVRAFTRVSPLVALARGIAKAVRQEITWLTKGR